MAIKSKPKPAPVSVKLPKTKKLGRPTAWKKEYIIDGERLAALGLSLKDMAYLWDLAPRTVQYWAERKPTFCRAIKKGESEKKSRLLTAMMAAAIRGAQATQIFLAKNWLGMKDVQDHALGGPGDKPILIQIVPAPTPEGGNGQPGDGGNNRPAEKTK